MSSAQLSEKINTLLQRMQNEAPSQAKEAAAVGARMRLEVEVQTRVCLGCEKADWLMTWASVEGHMEWQPVLIKCAAGVVLFPNDNGHGLEVPLAQFCTAKDDPYGTAPQLSGSAQPSSSMSQSKVPVNDSRLRQRGV